MKIFRQQLGLILKQARQQKKINQDVIAQRLGVTRTTISNIESGRQGVILDVFCEICRILSLDPGYTLKRAQETSDTMDHHQDIDKIDDPAIREIMKKMLSSEQSN